MALLPRPLQRPGFAMRRMRLPAALAATVLIVLLGPAPVLGYGGPGSIVSGIGTFLAAVAALAAAALGFIWFPLKRLYRKLFGRDSDGGEKGG
jgi:membrane protease YdiL (CAAX protease family)